MKEYYIAESGSPADVERIVGRRLNEGWQLYGNLAVAVCDMGAIFAQTMFRDDATDAIDVVPTK